ncbi:MAG: iron chelate uptake ABC transporter family permease subunit, partial [Prochlorothrix sp.]
MAKVRVLQLLLLLTIATGLFWSSLAIGSVNIPLGQLLPILRGEPVDNPIWSDIVWQLRLPRSLTAIVAGAALAVGGLQMQTLFRNPLADPSILG